VSVLVKNTGENLTFAISSFEVFKKLRKNLYRIASKMLTVVIKERAWQIIYVHGNSACVKSKNYITTYSETFSNV